MTNFAQQHKDLLKESFDEFKQTAPDWELTDEDFQELNRIYEELIPRIQSGWQLAIISEALSRLLTRYMDYMTSLTPENMKEIVQEAEERGLI